MKGRSYCFFALLLGLLYAGCANITTPTGGKKDITPPKLVSIDPPDSQLNTTVTRIEMHFNEYITVNDVGKEVQISPILVISPLVTGRNKIVTVKLIDSLLEPNTTYRISFGNAIRDLHEGNPFPKYTYSFSTGAYFDSLQLHGRILNAATGLPDTGKVNVVLYNAAENDTVVTRHKPRYITTTDAAGNFIFKGLPGRNFRVFALKDANGNLTYDGPVDGEWIGFADATAAAGDSSKPAVNFALFQELLDTTAQKKQDSVTFKKGLKKPVKSAPAAALTYNVNIDTSNIEKRSFDITGAIYVSFNNIPRIDRDKITLTYDSAGVVVSPRYNWDFDSVTYKLKINTDWRENTVYKLRLVKGFAKDSAGSDVVPSRYQFRTREEDDYGKVTLNFPAKYKSPLYVLKVLSETDSVYQKPLTDSVVILHRLKPGKYTFRLIVDKNHNGKWDTGDLLQKRQPEEVIPIKEAENIRAGWENIIDFEQKQSPKDKPAEAGK